MFYCVFVAVGGGERASLFSSLFFSFLLLSLLWLFRICLDLGAFFCLFLEMVLDCFKVVFVGECSSRPTERLFFSEDS